MKTAKTLIMLLLTIFLLGGCSHLPGQTTNAPTTDKNQSNENISAETPSAEEIQVEIKNFTFAPVALTIKTGATVIWINEDSALHNVKSDVLNSPDLARGESFRFTFNEAGEYDYICGIHPSMKGKIIVE